MSILKSIAIDYLRSILILCMLNEAINEMKKCIKNIVLIIIGMTICGVFFCHFRKTKVQPVYCRELYAELNDTSEQFKCTEVKIEDNENHIRLIFSLRNLDNYDYGLCIDDIIRIRSEVTNYLSGHPENKLAGKLISLQFQTLPGDTFTLSNFNSQKEGLFNDFPFCLCISIPISQYQYFINAISISITVEESDDLILLEKFNRLEYLYLIGPELSSEEKEYIVKLLDNCVIIYNGVKL